MPAPTAISCAAAPGAGGLGRHAEQLVDAARAEGRLERWWTTAPGSGEGVVVPAGRAATVVARTPLRAVAGLTALAEQVSFDRAVARTIDRPLTSFAAFTGQALHSMRAARAYGAETVGVVAASTHAAALARSYTRAHVLHPIERPWLSDHLRDRMIEEYGVADVIHVASDHTRDTFLAEAFPSESIVRHEISAATRYASCVRTPASHLDVVYVGALTVAKGVPVLLDAFARLHDPDARLTLVGGWSTRGMRRHLERTLATDRRIRIERGDPLPHLQRVTVLVHPSWGDGFGYAPAEAMAVGVPVVVTDQTGMSELVTDGVNGWIVPAGDADAIVDRLKHVTATA